MEEKKVEVYFPKVDPIHPWVEACNSFDGAEEINISVYELHSAWYCIQFLFKTLKLYKEKYKDLNLFELNELIEEAKSLNELIHNSLYNHFEKVSKREIK